MNPYESLFSHNRPQDEGDNEDGASLIENLIQIIEAESSDVISCNWLLGERLRKEISFLKDASLARKIIHQVSNRLNQRFKTEDYQPEFLQFCLRFADTFPDMGQTVELSEFLTWEHVLILSGLKDDLHRVFYTEQCRQHRYSLADLEKSIATDAFSEAFPEIQEDA